MSILDLLLILIGKRPEPFEEVRAARQRNRLI